MGGSYSRDYSSTGSILRPPSFDNSHVNELGPKEGVKEPGPRGLELRV